MLLFIIIIIIFIYFYLLLLLFIIVKSQVHNYVNFNNIIICFNKELLALNYSKILIHCSLYIIYISLCFNTFEAYFSYITHILTIIIIYYYYLLLSLSRFRNLWFIIMSILLIYFRIITVWFFHYFY